MTATEVDWEFEGADPEVGIFSATIYHTCDANLDDPEEAVIVDTTIRDKDANTVMETTTWTCPVDGATTQVSEQWPKSWFTEPGRADD